MARTARIPAQLTLDESTTVLTGIKKPTCVGLRISQQSEIKTQSCGVIQSSEHDLDPLK